MKAEKKTGRKISIKWSIFGYLLIFIFILLAILWVMQTVYLESFYKNIKERELKSAVSQVVEVMNGSQYKDEIEVLAKKNDIRVILGNSDGDRVYSTGSAATENISRMDSEQIKKLYKMAQDNGGEVHISSKKGLMDLSPRFDRPERRETVQEEDSGQSESRMMASMQPETDKNGEMQGGKEDLGKMFDIPENSGMETMIVAKIMTNAENEELSVPADFLNHVDETLHIWQGKKYDTIFYRAGNDNDDIQGLVMARCKKQIQNGHTQYAFINATPVTTKRDRILLDDITELIHSSLKLSDFQQDLNPDYPSKRFVYGYAHDKEIYSLEVEGQKPDGVIEINVYDRVMYLWYYNDLQSNKRGDCLSYSVDVPK